MATLTIKNLPPELYELLKERASQSRRSINSEAIVCLERTLVGERFDPMDFLVTARRLRESLPSVHLTDGLLDRAKAQGRT